MSPQKQLYYNLLAEKGIYKAARRQNYSSYEEGRNRLTLEKTKAGIYQALKKL